MWDFSQRTYGECQRDQLGGLKGSDELSRLRTCTMEVALGYDKEIFQFVRALHFYSAAAQQHHRVWIKSEYNGRGKIGLRMIEVRLLERDIPLMVVACVTIPSSFLRELIAV